MKLSELIKELTESRSQNPLSDGKYVREQAYDILLFWVKPRIKRILKGSNLNLVIDVRKGTRFDSKTLNVVNDKGVTFLRFSVKPATRSKLWSIYLEKNTFLDNVPTGIDRNGTKRAFFGFVERGGTLKNEKMIKRWVQWAIDHNDEHNEPSSGSARSNNNTRRGSETQLTGTELLNAIELSMEDFLNKVARKFNGKYGYVDTDPNSRNPKVEGYAKNVGNWVEPEDLGDGWSDDPTYDEYTLSRRSYRQINKYFNEYMTEQPWYDETKIGLSFDENEKMYVVFTVYLK